MSVEHKILAIVEAMVENSEPMTEGTYKKIADLLKTKNEKSGEEKEGKLYEVFFIMSTPSLNTVRYDHLEVGISTLWGKRILRISDEYAQIITREIERSGYSECGMYTEHFRPIHCFTHTFENDENEDEAKTVHVESSNPIFLKINPLL